MTGFNKDLLPNDKGGLKSNQYCYSTVSKGCNNLNPNFSTVKYEVAMKHSETG